MKLVTALEVVAALALGLAMAEPVLGASWARVRDRHRVNRLAGAHARLNV
jgi:hypothetical protein